MTATPAEFLHSSINTYKTQLKSYVRDTTDFINKISTIGELPEEAHLVTMDVKALYTNILNDKGLQALTEAIDKKQHKNVATTIIVKLMSLILTLNNFVFNDKNYLQIKGCAMGTICAPHSQTYSWENLE